MAGKLVIFLVVAIISFEGLNAKATPQRVRPGDIIDDIIDDAVKKAREAVHDVVAETKKVIEEGEATIEKAVEGIKSGLHSTVEIAEQVVESLGDKIVAQIEKLLKDAEALGLNATVCAEGKVEEAKKVEDDAVDAINKCVATAEQAGQVVKEDFQKAVQDTESQLDAMESEILSCIPETIDHTLAEANKIAKCLAGEVVEIHNMNKELLSKLAQHLKDAEDAVKSSVQQGVQCINSELKTVVEKGKDLVAEVKKCIEQLS